MKRKADVLAVFAHPDDESYAVGGTLARLSMAGLRLGLVCATAGEAGFRPGAVPLAEIDRAALRREELRDAARCLGIHDLWLLDYPDGRLTDTSPDLERELLAIVEEAEPDLLLSFSEDGMNGHRDHCALGRAMSIVVRQLRQGGCEAEFWRAAWVTSPLALLVGRHPAAPADEHLLQVDVKSVLRTKRRAILCHRSQLTWRNLAHERARAFWGREYFRTAPRSEPRSPRASFDFMMRSAIT